MDLAHNLNRFSVRLAAAACLAFAALVCFSGPAGAQDAPLGENNRKNAEPAPRLNLKDLGIGGFGGLAPGAGGEEEPVTFSASFELPKGSRRGTISLTAVTDPGWHVYSLTQKPGATMPSKITVPDSSQFKLLGPFQPNRDPEIKHYEYYKVPVEEHEGEITWTAPLELAEGVKPESLDIELIYNGQVCLEVCLPITNKKVPAKFAGYTAVPETPGEYRPKPSEAEVTIKGHVEPAAVVPGGKAKLVITAIPNENWHVYAYEPVDPKEVSKPTLIVLPKLPGWTQSAVKASAEPTIKPAEGGAPATAYYGEPVTWTVELTAPADSPVGEYVLTGHLGFQTCKDSGCLPPQGTQFRVSIPVAAKERAGTIPLEFKPARYSEVAKLAAANPPPSTDIDLAALLPVVGFGLLGGLILNLMPCVLPVIGLKVLSFAQQAGQSRVRIFALNAWFAAGLLLVFLILATAASFGSLVFGENLAWGQQFTYTWFKVAMIVVVFAFALSFLGVWEVPIPGFAQSGASSKLQQKEGASGAFFKGIFTTLLATPCSGPFLGPVFAYTLAQPPLVTYIIFASVGIGMAAPYLLIGAFPALIRALPKPGAWMETFKQLMGFLLLGTVVYLFATINADYFIATLALVIGVWFACWIIGRVPIYDDASKQVWAWCAGVAAAGAIGFASFTFLGPYKELLEWQPYSAASLAKLQSEGKTVMVDFTADWCLTCQANMKYAINTQRVKEVVEKNDIVPMVADWTDHNDAIRAKLTELNSNSIPLMAIYPANKPGEVILLPDLLSEGTVVEALEKAGPSKAVPEASGTATADAKTAGQPSG